jgi:uncharacterized protein YkwD
MDTFRFFTSFALLLLVVAGLATAGATDARAATPRTVAAVDSLESGLLVEINALRRRHGLTPLRLNRRLTSAADSHSQSMGTRGFFAHESADGGAFWKRVRKHYSDRGFRRWSVGETLLWSSWSITPAEALQMWLDSPPHRAILLTPRWREIGLSAVVAPSAPNVYDGADATIVTADFGVRS